MTTSYSKKRNLVSFAATWNLSFCVNHKNLWTLLSKSYLFNQVLERFRVFNVPLGGSESQLITGLFAKYLKSFVLICNCNSEKNMYSSLTD